MKTFMKVMATMMYTTLLPFTILISFFAYGYLAWLDVWSGEKIGWIINAKDVWSFNVDAVMDMYKRIDEMMK